MHSTFNISLQLVARLHVPLSHDAIATDANDVLLNMRTNKNSDASADWLVEIGPAHGECMRAATKRNRVLHICRWCNRIVLLAYFERIEY